MWIFFFLVYKLGTRLAVEIHGDLALSFVRIFHFQTQLLGGGGILWSYKEASRAARVSVGEGQNRNWKAFFTNKKKKNYQAEPNDTSVRWENHWQEN